MKINLNDILLVLNAVPGLSIKKVNALMQKCKDLCTLFPFNEKQLEETGVLSSKEIEKLIDFPAQKFLETEHRLINQSGVTVISIFDEVYPKQLKPIDDAPVVLYVNGRLPEQENMCLAIVGSRNASYYGLSLSEKFAMQLAQHGVAVVSGLARGIDKSAHQGALKVSGKTVAVLGSGLANIYPKEHEALAQDIVKSEGAVISEFPMQTLPLPYNFPRRNRIISGLSRGVIVVEAAKKSGALITADFALEQGRDVFAVPGQIDSPYSQGAHSLIKQGAKMITQIEDVLEEYGFPASSDEDKELALAENDSHVDALSSEEKKIYTAVSGRSVHIDELIGLCDGAQSALLRLELKRLVRQLPGKYFVKNTK